MWLILGCSLATLNACSLCSNLVIESQFMAFLNNESFTISTVSAILMIATGCSVVRKQETIGEYFDGSAITAEIKAKLANDSETSAASINIKTIEAGLFSSQALPSRKGRRIVRELARSINGVNEVRNSLMVWK